MGCTSSSSYSSVLSVWEEYQLKNNKCKKPKDLKDVTKFLVLGLQGVGKTCFINSLKEVTDNPALNNNITPLLTYPTNEWSAHIIESNGNEMIFIDTPPLPENRNIITALLPYSTKLIWLIDSTDELSLSLSCMELWDTLQSSKLGRQFPLYIVCNKQDNLLNLLYHTSSYDRSHINNLLISFTNSQATQRPSQLILSAKNHQWTNALQRANTNPNINNYDDNNDKLSSRRPSKVNNSHNNYNLNSPANTKSNDTIYSIIQQNNNLNSNNNLSGNNTNINNNSSINTPPNHINVNYQQQNTSYTSNVYSPSGPPVNNFSMISPYSDIENTNSPNNNKSNIITPLPK